MSKAVDILERRKLLLTPCKTKKELNNWIRYHLGIYLPDVKVSRYADTTPLDAVWEVYKICVLKQNPENILELLFVAGRGSGKTLGMAIAEQLVVLHDQRDVVHVGAIMSQAKRCYDYQKKFLSNDKLKDIMTLDTTSTTEDHLLVSSTMEKSVFNIDKESVTLEVLPCTLKACNGPHVPLVVVDEIDTVSGEGLKAFKEISGMLDSKGDKKALRVGISTRKSQFGLMNRQIENAKEEGRTVRRWTAFEFTEQCPNSRSGTEEMDLYIIQDKMEVVNKEEFDQKDPQKQREYEKHKGYTGCEKCPLFSICLTDAKKQTSKSPMLKTIDELVQKVRSEGSDWALSQLMNLKPSIEGIIFREFEEKVHVKNWNQMWKILTGKDYPGECTHDMFVKKCHEMQLSCYAGIDWGWSNPHTVVYFFVDKVENIYVVRCEGMTYISQPTWIHTIKMKWNNMYRTSLYFPDQADQGAVQEMKTAGLPAHNDSKKPDIGSGIQIIKKFLRVPTTVDPKLFLAEETCAPIITEFKTYHNKINASGEYTDDPEDDNNHWIDALRYPMTFLFGKSPMILSGDGLNIGDVSSIMDGKGNFYRSPTAQEFAISKGIPVNTEVDTSKIGKVGKLSDLDDDPDDDPEGGVNGSGSFLWTS